METAFAELMRQRRSTRAFTDQPVERVIVEEILRVARLAPSGANLQPGHFHALAKQSLTSLKGALAQAVEDRRPHDAEYSYFPDPMPAYLKARQRAAGFALYKALGIDRRDVEGRRAQFDRNYAFFDAPVGIVVTIERAMGKGCFMDLGMAVMSLLLAAEAAGLATTGIGALANHAKVVHQHLDLPDSEMVVCGIALGHADKSAPVNQFRTARASLDEYATFRGFED
ncbi:MAG: nitroreductase [Pseudomonadota bacterium]